MTSPELSPDSRARRQHVEAQRDEQMLCWVARFRFVSASVLEQRFATSERMCRRRLARLQAAGLLVSHQPHLAAAKLYAVSRPGAMRLGLPRRRAPRWDTQVTHELAIGGLVAQLEAARPDLRVLTERDCRRAEAAGRASYSVLCQQSSGAARRWPDIVIEDDDRRTAVEIELSPKTSERLKGIMLGYLTTRAYDTVQVRCSSQALEQRIRRIVEDLRGTPMIRVGAYR